MEEDVTPGAESADEDGLDSEIYIGGGGGGGGGNQSNTPSGGGD